MSPRYLITQSLLSAWIYLYKAREGYEEEARQDFLSTLNREEKPPTEAMLAGSAFESQVNAIADGPEPVSDYTPAGVIAALVYGGQKQVALYRNMTVNGMDFLLYGKLDYLKAGIIYDIKFTKSYEAGKYHDSPQHPFYFALCPEAKWFRYLISDGEDVFIENYWSAGYEHDIERIIAEFINFLTDSGLLETYKEKWAAKD